MLQDRLTKLFQQLDPALNQVILAVLQIEQEYISMERPRGIYERIDEVVARIAEDELRRNGGGDE